MIRNLEQSEMEYVNGGQLRVGPGDGTIGAKPTGSVFNPNGAQITYSVSGPPSNTTANTDPNYSQMTDQLVDQNNRDSGQGNPSPTPANTAPTNPSPNDIDDSDGSAFGYYEGDNGSGFYGEEFNTQPD